jgi:acetyl-CoA carboxylase biotin carboxyl carrier protein
MTDTQEGGSLTEVGSWGDDIVTPRVDETMTLLCQGLANAVRAAPCLPRRASVRFGCASIEVEWRATPDAGPPVDLSGAALAEAVDRHAVRAALVGTFYRALEPGLKPFVEVGDLVEPGQQLAILEAMKLMNPVVSDVRGRVVEILVADAESVEYDQPLLVVEPEAHE